MSGKGNRFGISPSVPDAVSSRRARDPGPMGIAVREAAASMHDASENLIEQRRQNAIDAKELRAARDEGRVLVSLPLDVISADSLPRDRLQLDAVASGDEMDELKASLQSRGQREPVEVFLSDDGRYQLKTGWRRLTALRQLFSENNDPRFATILARVTVMGPDRAELYVDMVEENVIRQDLSFAEMAQIAIQLALDPQAGVATTEEAVSRLFRSLHKVKRAYIRSFVTLLGAFGPSLPFPKAIARDLGVDVSRRLINVNNEDLTDLQANLQRATTADEQNNILRVFLSGSQTPHVKDVVKSSRDRPKFEFHVGTSKVTARKGEFRIKAAIDFASVERQVLERAVKAFHVALGQKD